jgi:hypothetical protein
MPIILPRSTDNRALFVCALLAHRALSPPTSSSLAEEKRLRSLLLSTAARDSRRSQGVARNCLQDASQRITLIGCGRYEDPRTQHRNGID